MNQDPPNPPAYLEARRDAGLLREYLARRFGALFTHGGDGHAWRRGRRLAGHLAAMIGATPDEVISQAKADYALLDQGVLR